MANKILHKNKRVNKTQLDLGRILAAVEGRLSVKEEVKVFLALLTVT
jgi:hypothetical protein